MPVKSVAAVEPGEETAVPEAESRSRSRRPRKPVATLADIAERAGVSKATASRVFAAPGTGPVVSPATRRRVLGAARELGWRPNRAARALARRRTSLIGALVLGFGEVTGSILDGVAAEAEGAGYDVIFRPYRRDEGAMGRALESLLEMRVEGILFYPASSEPIEDDRIASGLREVPCVLVDEFVDGLSLPLVTGDSVGGMRHVAGHLASLGHTDIGYLAGPTSSWGAQTRLSAFRAALKDHGLRLPDQRVARYDWEWRGAVRAAQHLLQSESPPSALATANDMGAAAVLQVARDLGVQVPDELAVVGFGDTRLSHAWVPPLTTVRQPVEALGQAACRLLLDLLRGEAGDEPQIRALPTELVIRGSCGGTAALAVVSPEPAIAAGDAEEAAAARRTAAAPRGAGRSSRGRSSRAEAKRPRR
jgi:LacI family transcriptional regulator